MSTNSDRESLKTALNSVGKAEPGDYRDPADVIADAIIAAGYRKDADVRADQIAGLADRMSAAFGPQGSRGEEFEVGFCAALDWLRAEATTIRTRPTEGESS